MTVVHIKISNRKRQQLSEQRVFVVCDTFNHNLLVYLCCLCELVLRLCGALIATIYGLCSLR